MPGSEPDADRPGRPATAHFLAALHVKRNASVGVGSGVCVATAVYLFFVVLGPETLHSPVYYLGLAFVLATAVAGIVTLVLTIRAAVALSGTLPDSDADDPDAEAAFEDGETDPAS